MEITLLGTGAGIPQADRAQSSLLISDEEVLLIDCGAGALLRLGEIGLSPLEVDAVVLTHLHLDHVADLLPLAKARYLLGEPWLRVWGPVGTERWLLSLQSLYPYLHSIKLEVSEIDAGCRFEVCGFDMLSASAAHSVPALCYRVEGSSTVTCSGDTEPTERLSELASGSDLLVHECSFPDGFDVTNHTTPTGLGNTIRGVKEILLTHFYPQCRGLEEDMARTVERLSGIRTRPGRDLMGISLS
ncbi:MAG: MBL fold metallo-hydrolase [Methanothrix sp.]|uniref:MBL fold metallo-hydrolase n=1 Tax=Methanothrix sp. TaxID=90426 RepID=UPI0025D23380|nr:MBL fold metallo-hydrolase [Methanothrix sp.]MCQ8904019.1 MBL fold metallo-hydrolase [Methanothrix sp.]